MTSAFSLSTCLASIESVYLFVFVQAVAFFKYIASLSTSDKLKPLLTFAIVGCAGVVFLTVTGLTFAGVIAPWSGR